MAGQSETPSRTGIRVLIVDDNESLALTYAWLLEDAGFTVETCHNGADALVCIDRFHPHILLLDIGMPVMDGLQLCRTVRAHEAWKDLGVVAQSGYGDEDMRGRTREAGFDRHLVKPIEFNDLLKTLTEVLAERKPVQSSDDPVGPL
ncbi:response regulator [Asticcacaulis solisilvae]|uniref:response regulator n=1 Tax=Asticcacaulis solisilvae TaxID=1217274 RepID=UPI003FD6DB22